MSSTREERLAKQEQLIHEGHKLFLLLARTYYDHRHCLVATALTKLAVGGRKVNEVELCSALKLPIKFIHERLGELSLGGSLASEPVQLEETQASIQFQQKQQQLKQQIQPSLIGRHGNASAPITKHQAMINRFERSRRQTYAWWVDFEVLVQSITYRHEKMLRSFNQQAEYTYVCPSQKCPAYMKPLTLLQAFANRTRQLQMGGGSLGGSGGSATLLCDIDLCRTPLVEKANEVDRKLDMKIRFNTQLQVLNAQKQVVEQLLLDQIALAHQARESGEDIVRHEQEMKLARQLGRATTAGQGTGGDKGGEDKTSENGSGSVVDEGKEERERQEAARIEAMLLQHAEQEALSSSLRTEHGMVTKLESIVASSSISSSVSSSLSLSGIKAEEKSTLPVKLETDILGGEGAGARGVKEEIGVSGGVEMDMGMGMVGGDDQVYGENGAVTEDTVVYVQGEAVRLSEVTQEQLDLMTEEEILYYESLFQ